MSETESQKIKTKAEQEGKIKPPFLKLFNKEGGKAPVSTGQHLVKFLGDKRGVGNDFHTKREREEMHYLFEKEGQKYRYYVSLFARDEDGTYTEEYNYFVLKMAEYSINDELILEGKTGKNGSFIDIQKVKIEFKDDEIPTQDEPEPDYNV